VSSIVRAATDLHARAAADGAAENAERPRANTAHVRFGPQIENAHGMRVR
jgi:hypothetical protein